MTLEELLAANNIPTRVERRGWLQLTCPNCRRQWYLGYQTAYGYFHCWKCGRQDFHNTVKALGFTYADARGLDRRRQRLPPDLKPTGRFIKPAGVEGLHPAHERYLKRRGFKPAEIVRLWGVGGIGPHAPRLRWRLYLPISYHGRTVSWTTRAIADNVKLRYISAGLEEEAVPHKNILYGSDACRHAVVVCEGPTDAWAIGPGAVATLGVSYSPAQVAEMARYPVRAICFDAEAGAQQRARRLMADLAVFPGTTSNIVLDAKDPATAPRRDIQLIRKEFLE